MDDEIQVTRIALCTWRRYKLDIYLRSR